MFKALVIDNNGGTVTDSMQNIDEASLPPGNVTVAVEYSTLNYKDGLVVTGAGGLVKRYPHVPGIDFAGRVLESRHPTYKPGDPVVLTGWRVGEVQWGGLAQKASVNGDWLVPLPAGLTTRQAMAVGTAGFTAMLAVLAPGMTRVMKRRVPLHRGTDSIQANPKSSGSVTSGENLLTLRNGASSFCKRCWT